MAVSPPSSAAAPPEKRASSILGTLRAAVRRVRFLLSSSATRWMLLSSVVGRGPPRRALSFNPRSPSLLDAASPSRTSRSTSMGTATTRSVSRTSSGASPGVLTRTSSGGSASASPGGDEDIDRRADEFIANFYRQLQMERQVSLQLRYVRGNSWDRSP